MSFLSIVIQNKFLIRWWEHFYINLFLQVIFRKFEKELSQLLPYNLDNDVLYLNNHPHNKGSKNKIFYILVYRDTLLWGIINIQSLLLQHRFPLKSQWFLLTCIQGIWSSQKIFSYSHDTQLYWLLFNYNDSYPEFLYSEVSDID
jgi:hypothetical protein